LVADYKQIVIPTNLKAQSYEKSMQFKVMILSALFFVRFQGGSQSLDDFFTFARKHIGEKQASDTSFVYRAELNTLLIA